MKTIFLMSLLVCSALCYAQEDDPFGLYEKGASRTKKYDLEKEYKVKEKSLAPFVGLNLGIGGDFGKGFSTLEGTIGLDVAGSINDRFAMGGYFSYQTFSAVSLGLFFVHGNHNKGFSFLWGIGYTTPEVVYLRAISKEDPYYENYSHYGLKLTPNLRLGVKLKNGLYFMTDIEVSERTFSGDYTWEYEKQNFQYLYYYHRSLWNKNYKKSFDINFRIGWKFNLNKKK